MNLLPEGPDADQVVRDLAGNFDQAAMDAQTAVQILQRMRRSSDNLRRAVRWPGSSNRWSEPEKIAAEYDFMRQVEAIDFALDVLSLLTGAFRWNVFQDGVRVGTGYGYSAVEAITHWQHGAPGRASLKGPFSALRAAELEVVK